MCDGQTVKYRPTTGSRKGEKLTEEEITQLSKSKKVLQAEVTLEHIKSVPIPNRTKNLRRDLHTSFQLDPFSECMSEKAEKLNW